MNYLNINTPITMFSKYLNDKIYIDKSLLIEEMNQYLDTGDNSICITRPRRFGKTYNANMLAAYYTKGYDSKELFDGLKISQCNDYLEHINHYNVVYIDFSQNNDQCSSYDEYISPIKSKLQSDLKSQYHITIESYDHVYDWFYKTNDSFVFI